MALKHLTYILGISLFWGLSACDLTMEVDLDIPPYDNPYVVESYLQPGQPFFMVLTRGQEYFDTIRVETVEDAEVTVSFLDDTVSLDGVLFDLEDPQTLLTLNTLGANVEDLLQLGQLFNNRIYIYINLFRQVPELYDQPFTLDIETPDGTLLRSVTTIPAPVPIDDFSYFLDEDSMGRTFTTFTDPEDKVNFYRRLLELRDFELDSVGFDPGSNEIIYDTIWVNRVWQDIYTGEENLSVPPAFGTLNDFEIGDTLFSSIYSITEDYLRFIETRDAAFNAAFSPFGQPAALHTNIEGGAGIFTGFSFDREELVIGE